MVAEPGEQASNILVVLEDANQRNGGDDTDDGAGSACDATRVGDHTRPDAEDVSGARRTASRAQQPETGQRRSPDRKDTRDLSNRRKVAEPHAESEV